MAAFSKLSPTLEALDADGIFKNVQVRRIISNVVPRRRRLSIAA